MEATSTRTRNRLIGLTWSALVLSGLIAWAAPVRSASIPGVGEIPEIPAFLPTMETVPATQPLPIDGIWSIREISKTVRIDRGRVYAVDGWTHLFVLKIQPGMVVIKDLRATAPGEYAGFDLPLQGAATYRMTRERTLSVDVQGMLGPVRLTFLPLQLDNPGWHGQAMAEAGLGAATPSGYQPVQYQPPAACQPVYRTDTDDFGCPE